MRPLRTLLAPTPFDPHTRFFTSPLLPATLLAAARLLIAAYILTALVFSLAYASIHDPQRVGRHWSYFTNITNWSAGFYFLFAGGHGAVYCARGTPPLQRWPAMLQAAHSILWTTVVTFPVLVTVVYWAVLAPDGRPFATVFDGWSNVSVHALNSVWAVFEVVATACEPPPWVHVPVLVLFLAGYLGVAYVTHATQGFYTYGFLDPGNGAGMLVGYIFGILVGVCVLFAIVRGAVWARMWLLETKLGMAPKRAARDPQRGVEMGWAGETGKFGTEMVGR